MILYQLAEKIGQKFSKEGVLVSFQQSHAAAKPFNVCGMLDTKGEKPNHLQKAILLSFSHNTLIDLVEFVHPVHVNCENKGDKAQPSKDQHSHKTTLIAYHSHEQKIDNRVT